MEQQLSDLQAEKRAAAAAAAKLVAGNEEKAAEMERQLLALKTEMEAHGKSQVMSTTQGKCTIRKTDCLRNLHMTGCMSYLLDFIHFVVEEEKKRRKEVEQQLALLQTEKRAAITAVTAEKDSQLESARQAGKIRKYF